MRRKIDKIFIDKLKTEKGYTFVKVLSETRSDLKTYLLHDFKNDEYVAKVYIRGRDKNRYFWFKNEVSINRILNNVIHKPIKSGKFLIDIPEYKDHFIIGKYEVLINKKVGGIPFSTLNSNFKKEVLFEVINFFNLVSKKISDKDRASLKLRSIYYYFLISPILFVISFLKNPNLFFYEVSLILNMFKHFRLEGNSLFVLTHRDLNCENILIEKNRIHIIDFEAGVLSNVSTELSLIFLKYWRDKTLISQMLESKEMVEMMKNIDSYKLLKIDLIFNALTELSLSTSLNETELKSYIDFSISN